MFAYHVSDPGHDGLALGLREKIDFHLDALTELIGLLQLQQHSGHAQVQDLPCAPFRFGNRAHTRRPSARDAGRRGVLRQGAIAVGQSKIRARRRDDETSAKS